MNEHHPWCNYFYGPREGCKMCDRLFAQYPVEGKTPSELLAEHFPDAIVVKDLSKE
jgi:hypothetical protein